MINESDHDRLTDQIDGLAGRIDLKLREFNYVERSKRFNGSNFSEIFS